MKALSSAAHQQPAQDPTTSEWSTTVGGEAPKQRKKREGQARSAGVSGMTELRLKHGTSQHKLEPEPE